ncbi:hypothetical protein Tco_0654444 [Tanacetum coccineum]|uniref:Uncharacterized protein n=1 Tax=Tanacetum coccineum TaxID=301880 RepID=A0ABQ4X3S7_9ASTR
MVSSFDYNPECDEEQDGASVSKTNGLGGYLLDSAMLMLSTEGFENLIASVLSSNVMWCVWRGKVLRYPFFITKANRNAILEFSAIVSSELFDFDVILIFNSFDE